MKDEKFVEKIINRYHELRKTYLSEDYLNSYIDETIEYLYDCKKTIEADKDYEIEDYLVSASTLLEILKGE